MLLAVACKERSLPWPDVQCFEQTATRLRLNSEVRAAEAFEPSQGHRRLAVGHGPIVVVPLRCVCVTKPFRRMSVISLDRSKRQVVDVGAAFHKFAATS